MSEPSSTPDTSSREATGPTTPKEDPPMEAETEQPPPPQVPVAAVPAHIPVRGSAMPVLPQHGKVYIGPGAKKEAQVLGLGLSSLHRSERSDLDRAKRFAMDQSIKYLMQKQQTAHQENQQKVAMYAQALSLMARVYVGSISFEIREDQLRETFGEYGPIKSVNMSFDASTGHHKGYAFLEYEIPEGALLAQEAMNGLMMGGRNIKVERGRVQLQLGRPQAMPQAQPIIDMIMTEARKYHRIYVASVHEDLNENDLRTVFSSFGNIIKCQLAKSASGKHRGFGYIEFDTPRAAAEAITGMNMFDLGGKLMRVGKCITPPEALSYIVPNTQTQLPTAAAMAAAAITARIQAQEAAGKSGIKPPPSPELSPIRDRRRRSPPKERERKKAASPLRITAAAAQSNGTSNGKTSTRFGERSAIAPPPSIIDPLARTSSPKPIQVPVAKHRPTFAPAATVEVVEKPKAQKPKDILSRIKIQPTLKPGVKATFAHVSSGGFGGQESNIFEEEQEKKPTLSITGPETSKALAMIMESKAVAVIKDGQKPGASGALNATTFKRKSKKITGPKAKGPQLNSVQALQAAEKAGAISDLIHQAGQENDEQPLSAMEIGEIRGNDARHLLMRKLMRNEHTRVMLLKKMVYPEEVDDFLKDEVKEECEKHGPVKDVTIVQVRGEIRIFVRYEKMEDATKARGIFDKRFFNGRQIEATYYDEELLNHQDYLG
uniref:RRM domain-containing protein n=1 Tax=Panagrolaimus sp. PS1159 TaxID=55785 RepID=A0AC35FBP7_9BILA